MARPTKLTAELLEKAQGYIETCKDEKEIFDNGKTLKVYWSVNLPSIEGLALYIDVNRDTIYAWEHALKDERQEGEAPPENLDLLVEFSDTITRVREEQARRLLSKGLGGQYNPQIAKVILARHGYVDREERKVEGPASEAALAEASEKLAEIAKALSNDKPAEA